MLLLVVQMSSFHAFASLGVAFGSSGGVCSQHLLAHDLEQQTNADLEQLHSFAANGLKK